MESVWWCGRKLAVHKLKWICRIRVKWNHRSVEVPKLHILFDLKKKIYLEENVQQNVFSSEWLEVPLDRYVCLLSWTHFFVSVLWKWSRVWASVSSLCESSRGNASEMPRISFTLEQTRQPQTSKSGRKSTLIKGRNFPGCESKNTIHCCR